MKLTSTLTRIDYAGIDFFRSDEGLTLETSALYSLRWPIYIFNLVDTTKLSIFLVGVCQQSKTTVAVGKHP